MDCHKIQPDLQLYASQPGMGPNISERIRWVSGNMYVSLAACFLIADHISLDPLPFKRNCFDFVRVCCVGLGIPEDEASGAVRQNSPPADVTLLDTIFLAGLGDTADSQ